MSIKATWPRPLDVTIHHVPFCGTLNTNVNKVTPLDTFMKVIKKGFRFKFSFSNRMVNEWNVLSEEIIQSKSFSGFKKDWLSSRIHQGIYISSIWASFLLFVEINQRHSTSSTNCPVSYWILYLNVDGGKQFMNDVFVVTCSNFFLSETTSSIDI